MKYIIEYDCMRKYKVGLYNAKTMETHWLTPYVHLHPRRQEVQIELMTDDLAIRYAQNLAEEYSFVEG